MRLEIFEVHVIVATNFLPFAQVVVTKQDSAFENRDVSLIPKIYFVVVEYKARQVLKRT